MKFNATVTRRCNLRCPYCYVSRDTRDMSGLTARKAVELAVSLLPPGGLLDFGFFGGEPLLRFDFIRDVLAHLRRERDESGLRFRTGMTTNGTLLTPRILDVMAEEEMVLCVSLDGPEEVHAQQRGNGVATRFEIVVENLELAVKTLPTVKINAVYGPDSISRLPDSIAFLSRFGAPVELNLDIVTPWRETSLRDIDDVFARVGGLYLERAREGRPLQLQPLTDHILTGLLGGADPACRCKLGVEELAVDVDGLVYPCERLIGRTKLSIGDVDRGIDRAKQARVVQEHLTPHPSCVDCPIRNFCNHSCGCTNWFLTGSFGTAHRVVCRIETAWFDTMRGLLEPLRAEPAFIETILGFARSRCHLCREEKDDV